MQTVQREIKNMEKIWAEIKTLAPNQKRKKYFVNVLCSNFTTSILYQFFYSFDVL